MDKNKSKFQINNIPAFFKKLLKSRKMKYGSNAIILTIAIIALAVVLNMVVDLADLKVDLTPNKLYSIEPATEQILKELGKDVYIYGLFDEGTVSAGGEYKEVLDILNLYEKYPHIKTKIEDPDRNPGFIKQIDPDNLYNLEKNDFLVKCGNKMKKLSYYDLFSTQMDQQSFEIYKTGSSAEQGFTGAIKFVTSDKTPTVYFTEGHKELSLNSDFTRLKGYIEMNNYAVQPLNLLLKPEVPEDAEVVVFASPKEDLTVKERDKLAAYMKKGGNVIFLFDSMQNGPEFTEVNKFLMDYNIAINNDMVRENDESRHLPNDPYSLIVDVESSEVIPDNFSMFLSGSRSIRILKNEKEFVSVISLATSSGESVGEQIDKTAGEDMQGPLDIAAAVDYKGGSKPTKLLVIGNASFISDSAESQYGPYYRNGMIFFLGSLSWMQGRANDTVIAPKAYQSNTLAINAMQATVTGIVVVVVLPLLILGCGTYVYLKRRHL